MCATRAYLSAIPCLVGPPNEPQQAIAAIQRSVATTAPWSTETGDSKEAVGNAFLNEDRSIRVVGIALLPISSPCIRHTRRFHPCASKGAGRSRYHRPPF